MTKDNSGFPKPSKYANPKTGHCKKCGRIKFLQPSSIPFCPTDDCPNFRKFLVKGVLDIAG